MLYFGWQQTQLLLSLIWLSYLHTIKIAYTSWCTDAFSWAANSVCPALLLLAKQSLRLTLPLPMTLVKLGLPVQIPVALWNICQVQSSLTRSYKKASCQKQQLPDCTEESSNFRKQKEHLTSGFQLNLTSSSRKDGQVYETRKREWLIFCLLLKKTDLTHGSVFINSWQNPTRLSWLIHWVE